MSKWANKQGKNTARQANDLTNKDPMWQRSVMVSLAHRAKANLPP